MRLSENRPVACAVLALCIVVSLLLGGGSKLMQQRSALIERFNAPAESIGAELQEMRTNAVTLLGIASGREDANAQLVKALSSAVDALDLAEDISDKYAASTALHSAVESCYAYLTTLSLSDMTAKDVRYAYKNFTSAQLRISHDDYNLRASEFNQVLSGFPANLIGAVCGVKPLGLFR